MEGFDDIIRGKLAALESQPSGAVPDWADLSGRLDGEAFDTTLREALTDTPTPVPGVVAMVPGWDMLADRLDALSEPEGEAFDQLLSDKLRRAATPVAAVDPTPSWRRLSHRMDTFWPLRRRLVRYRVLEVAAAAAVILTLLPVLREQATAPPWTDMPVAESATWPAATDPSATLERSGQAATAYGAIGGSGEATQADRALTSAAPAAASAAGPRTGSQPSASPERLPTPLSLLRDAYDWLAGEQAGELAHPSAQAIAARVSTRPGEAQRETRGSSPRESAARLPATPVAFATELAKLDLVELASLPFADPELGLPIPTVSARNTASPWRVAVEAGPRVWQIRTPARRNLRLAAATVREPGVGAQASITRALGARAELGVGLGVSTIDYDPDFPTLVQDNRFQTGSRRLAQAETIDRVSVTVAKLPVDLRYDVLAGASGHRRLRLWAKAGLAANLSVGNDYGLTREVGEIQTLTTPTATDPGAVESPDGLYSENVTPGFFEPGGEFAENAFVTARLGLEAEVTLGERASAFAGIDYDRFLRITEGLGPTDDQPSQLGLSVGFRYTL